MFGFISIIKYILIFIYILFREEYEGTDSWLKRNYKIIEDLSMQINEYAPSHMKIIFCSMSLPCFYANIMHELVTKLSSTNIVVASAHYGLQLIYSLANSLGLTQQNFGCPPVWGFLGWYIRKIQHISSVISIYTNQINLIIGINHFVDIHHMIQMYNMYHPNKRALNLNKNMVLPSGIEHSELRWFFYMAHDKNPYKDHFKRKV